MVSAIAPFAILIGVGGAVALLFLAFWDKLLARLIPITEPYHSGLERAAINVKTEELVFTLIGAAATAWILTMVFVRPGILIGVLALPAYACLSFYICRLWINIKIARRLEAFNNQLELALRMICSGIRVGLGLRQAIVLVIQEMPDPIHTEFMRVLGQTTIGVGINDALDQLCERMPSREVVMMTRAIRIQTQTGGNLSKILDNLAITIKERRRIHRKARTMTAEGRFSMWIVLAMPICLFGFIAMAQPHMRDSFLFTTIGHLCLVAVVCLQGTGAFVMSKIMKFKV